MRPTKGRRYSNIGELPVILIVFTVLERSSSIGRRSMQLKLTPNGDIRAVQQQVTFRNRPQARGRPWPSRIHLVVLSFWLYITIPRFAPHCLPFVLTITHCGHSKSLSLSADSLLSTHCPTRLLGVLSIRLFIRNTRTFGLPFTAYLRSQSCFAIIPNLLAFRHTPITSTFDFRLLLVLFSCLHQDLHHRSTHVWSSFVCYFALCIT